MEVKTLNGTLDDIVLNGDRILLEHKDPTMLRRSPAGVWVPTEEIRSENTRPEVWMQLRVAKVGTEPFLKDLKVGDSVLWTYMNDEPLTVDGKKYYIAVSQALMAVVNAPDDEPEAPVEEKKVPFKTFY